MQYIISRLYPVWATVDELYLTAIILQSLVNEDCYAEKLCLGKDKANGKSRQINIPSQKVPTCRSSYRISSCAL